MRAPTIASGGRARSGTGVPEVRDLDGVACRQAGDGCGRFLWGVLAISEVHGDIADLLKGEALA